MEPVESEKPWYGRHKRTCLPTRRSKSHAVKSVLLVTILTVATGTLAGLFDPITSIQITFIGRNSPVTHDQRYAKEMFLDPVTGLPSTGCMNEQHDFDVYSVHWKRAYDIFLNSAPEEVKSQAKPLVMDKSFNISLRIGYMKAAYGYQVQQTKGYSPSAYVRIWKSGNDNIRYNMNKLSDVSSREYWRHEDLLRAIEDDSIVFTFVRDPIKRWISGVNELEERWGAWKNKDKKRIAMNPNHHCPCCILEQFQIGTEERVWAFLHDILVCHMRGLPQREHIFPQSGVLLRSGSRLNWLGKLERFEQEHKDYLLREIFHTPDYQWDNEAGQHSSSKDPYGVLVAGKNVATHPNFKHILQLILFKDFLCFGYKWHEPIE